MHGAWDLLESQERAGALITRKNASQKMRHRMLSRQRKSDRGSSEMHEWLKKLVSALEEPNKTRHLRYSSRKTGQLENGDCTYLRFYHLQGSDEEIVRTDLQQQVSDFHENPRRV